MCEKVEGIVLKSTDYKESSKIVHVFLKKYGLTSFLVRGAKRQNFKFSSAISPITNSLFSFTKKKGLIPLNEAKIIQRFDNIKNDILTTSYVYNILELIYVSLEKDTGAEQLYDYLMEVIYKINDGFSPLVANLIFKVKMLFYNGLSPNLLRCSTCGEKSVFYDFDIDNLSGKCKDCSVYSNKNNEYSTIIKNIYYLKKEDLFDLEISNSQATYLYKHFIDVYKYKAGIVLKSESVLQQLQ